MMRLFRRASKITNIPAYDKLEPSKDQNDKLTSDGSDAMIMAQVSKGGDQNKNKEVHEKTEIKNSTYAKVMLDQREGPPETNQSSSMEASPNSPKEASPNEASNQNSRSTMIENTRYTKNSPANNMSDNTHQPDYRLGDPLDRNSKENRQEESRFASGISSHTAAAASIQDHAGVSGGHWERNLIPVSTSDKTMVPIRLPDHALSAEIRGQVRVPRDHRISPTQGEKPQNVHINADRRRYTRKSDASSDSHSRSSSSSYNSHGSYSRTARTRIINHPLPGSANMVIDSVNTATVPSGAADGAVNSHFRGDDTTPKQSPGYTNGKHYPGYVNQMVGPVTSKYASGDSSSSSSNSRQSNHSRVDQSGHGRYDHNANAGRYDGSGLRSEDRSGEVHLGPRADRPGMPVDEMNFVEMEGHPVNRYGKYDQRTARSYVEGYEHKMGDPKMNYANYKQERGKVSPQRKKLKNEYSHNMYQYGMNQQQPYMNQYMNYPNMGYQNYVNVNHYSQKHGEYQPHNTERHQMQGAHANQYQYKQAMRGGNGDHSKYYRDQYYTSPSNRNVDQYVGYPAYPNVHYPNMVDPGPYKNYKVPMQKVNMYTQLPKQIKPRQSSALQILNPDTGEVVNSKKTDTKGESSKVAPAGATAVGGSATADGIDSVAPDAAAIVDSLTDSAAPGESATDVAGHVGQATATSVSQSSASISSEFAPSDGMFDVPSSSATDVDTTCAVERTTDITAHVFSSTSVDRERGEHGTATGYLVPDHCPEEVDGKELDSCPMERTAFYMHTAPEVIADSSVDLIDHTTSTLRFNSTSALRDDDTFTKNPGALNDVEPAGEDHDEYQQENEHTPSEDNTQKEEESQKEADTQEYKKMEEVLSPFNVLKYAQTNQSQLSVNNMSQLPSMHISKTRLRVANKPINPLEKLYTLTELHPYNDAVVPKERSKSQQRKIRNRPLNETGFNEEINGVDGARLMGSNMDPNIIDAKKEPPATVDMGTSTELSDLILENSDSGSDSNKSRSLEQTDYECNRKAVMDSGVMVTQYKAVDSKAERGHVPVDKESGMLPQGPTYLFDTSVAVKTASGTVGATLASTIGGFTSGAGVKSLYGSAAASAVASVAASTAGSATTGTTSADASTVTGAATHGLTSTVTATTIGTAAVETGLGRTRIVPTAEDDPADPLRFSTLKMIYMGQELRRIGLEKDRSMGTFKLVPLNYSVGSSITSHASQGSFQSHSSFSEGYTTGANTRRKAKKDSRWRSELSIEKEELAANKPRKPALSKKEQFKRSVRTLLNKLTVENFLVVSEKIATLYKEAEDHESVRVVVDLLHEKATHELEYSDMYADLAFLLKYSFNDTLDVGSKTTCFHKTLLNKCQDSFEEISTNHGLDKTYILGNIRFMGELFLRKILSITILKRISCTLMTSKCPEEGSCAADTASSQRGSATRTTNVANEVVGAPTSAGATDSSNVSTSIASANTPAEAPGASGSDGSIVGDTQVVGGSDSGGPEAARAPDDARTGCSSVGDADTSVASADVTGAPSSHIVTGTLTSGTTAADAAPDLPPAKSGTACENADRTGAENVRATEIAARTAVDAADSDRGAPGSAGSTGRSSNASDDMEFRPPANLIECFSELLTTIGYTVDQIPGGSDMLDEYLAILISLKKSGIYPTRINFKIQDLIDLRKRNWRKKLFKEKATSVSQIHRLAEQEQLRGGPQEGRFVTAGLQTNRHYTPYLLKNRQQVVDSLVNGVYTQESAQKLRESGASEGRRDESFHPQVLKLFTSAVGRDAFQNEWRSYRPTDESVTHAFDQMLKATMSAKSLDLCLAHADILSLTLARLVDSEALRAKLLNMLCEHYVVNLQEEVIDNPWAMDIVSKTLTMLFNDFTGESRNLLEKIPIPKHFPTTKQLVVNIVNGTRELGGDLGFTRRVIRRHLYSTFHNENLLFLDEI
ncbi:hypothetical protein MACJ_000495 [Theileria orientalis]|uniref:MIF4G domain-containing protein n=1 Tax=Theileria orientalis TaxID=68886 RepID=A0A976QQI0_THEOR|nr:hypothetical protein MACJ_000495 [Theileria orientalis]